MFETLIEKIKADYPDVYRIDPTPSPDPYWKTRGTKIIDFGNTGLVVCIYGNREELHFMPNDCESPNGLRFEDKFFHSLMLVSGMAELCNFWNVNERYLPATLYWETFENLSNQFMTLTLDLPVSQPIYRVLKDAGEGKIFAEINVKVLSKVVCELYKNYELEDLAERFTFFKRFLILKKSTM